MFSLADEMFGACSPSFVVKLKLVDLLVVMEADKKSQWLSPIRFSAGRLVLVPSADL